jgi:hypothetical protein
MSLPKYKFVMLSMLSASLISCATVYQSPVSGPRAKLGVLSQSVVPSHSQLGIFNDPVNCTGLQNLDISSLQHHGASVTIAANRLTTIFNVYSITGYHSTNLAFSFNPKANENYLLVSNHPEANEKNKLNIDFAVVKEVISKNGKIKYVPVPFIKRKLISSISTSVPNCADFNSVGA